MSLYSLWIFFKEVFWFFNFVFHVLVNFTGATVIPVPGNICLRINVRYFFKKNFGRWNIYIILLLYACFSKFPFSPFIWREAKVLVLWLTFPINTDFSKGSLISLIVIFTLQLQPSTLQAASCLKYGGDFLNTQTQWQFSGCKNSFKSSVHLVLIFCFR